MERKYKIYDQVKIKENRTGKVVMYGLWHPLQRDWSYSVQVIENNKVSILECLENELQPIYTQ